MKKIIFFSCFIITIQTAFAQNKTADSLKIVLSKISKPIERFNLLNKIFETNDITLGTLQDSSTGLQMHRIAQQLNNDSLIAISTNVIGNYFRGKSDIPTALDYFFKAIPLAEKVNDKRRISSLYFDIAECYYNLLNLEKCYKYAITGAQNLPDRDSPMFDYMAVQFYRTMGNYYLKKNMPDSALKQIHELEEVNSRLKRISYILYSYIQNGTAYYQLGENDLAEIYFKKARVVSDSIATPGRTQLFINAYIPYLFATNQVEKARQQAFELLNIGIQIDNNLTKLNAAGYLSQAYNRLHQSDSAFYYLSLESSLKDSVFNQTNINKIQALAFNEQIRRIDEEAKQVMAEQQRKQNIQYALLALGIITFVILFLALSRRHITNTKVIQFLGVVGLLVVFEFLNLLLHPFLERITHHNPILMLLALVCIAALLVPLHHKLEKWATHKLIEKNKQIRLAAAKKTIEELEK